jgi:integrase
MHCGELKRLTPANVQLHEGDPTVAVPASKGGYARRVLERRRCCGVRAFGEQALFGGVFSAASLRRRLHLACSNLQVPPIRPHDLRHTFASWLVNEGRVSLRTVHKILGDRKIEMTLHSKVRARPGRLAAR